MRTHRSTTPTETLLAGGVGLIAISAMGDAAAWLGLTDPIRAVPTAIIVGVSLILVSAVVRRD